MPIRKLSEILISRIAAGEVVERPASVVKELVENSIDANAKNITVHILAGGRSLIKITDDGDGIAKDELPLAVTRHATSKLKGNNLLEINSLGFRGEGIAAICSIANVTIASKEKQATDSWSIKVDGGDVGEVAPYALNNGTVVTVRNLFYATPARLKFLKSDKVENGYIAEIIKRLAMSHPEISFTLYIDDKEICDYQSDASDNLQARIYNILGKEFAENSVAVNYDNPEIKIKGFISYPTFNRATNASQFTFVNNRFVKDKIILSAIKAVYQDLVSHGRYPVVALFVEVPYEEVDVNIHPAKAEVKFRNASSVRGQIISALHKALSNMGHQTANTISLASGFQQGEVNLAPQHNYTSSAVRKNWFAAQGSGRLSPSYVGSNISPSLQGSMAQMAAPSAIDAMPDESQADYPLGTALCQLHETYIVAQNKEGVVIVDQHAAHERLVYEDMKQSLGDKVVTQKHLLNEIVELSETEINNILQFQQKLARYGLKIEKFGVSAITVTETPAIFGEFDVKSFIKDIVDNIAEYGDTLNIDDKFNEIYGNIACRYSIRAGRRLNIAEMNDILRKMEQTNFSGQCNHGRPTYVILKLGDLEKMFERG